MFRMVNNKGEELKLLALRNHKIYHFFKRTFDIIISLLALIISSPFFLVIGLIIYFQDHGPVFYAQTRIGRGGQPFKIYKFRSMILNANEKLKKNHELYKKYVADGYKLPAEEDPRITKVGKILRRSSLDELPQFFNVLKGNMSMVGPRPVVKEELCEYSNKVKEFLSVKPGIFGLWQASGRSKIIYPKRCKVELKYVENASATYDLKIFFKTIISIFKGQGAV